MSRLTIKDIAAQVELLTEVVGQLAQAQVDAANKAPVNTAPPSKPKAADNEVFEAKFKTQLSRAKKLAAKNGTGAKLLYVDGKSVWYMSESRKDPRNSTLLATVRADGSVVAHAVGIDHLIKKAA